MASRNYSRRRFLRDGLNISAGCFLPAISFTAPVAGSVMTVRGPVTPGKLGFTLSHEHILVDFAGADKISKSSYQEQDVYDKALPALEEVKRKSCNTIIDCTPAYLGRDVRLLKRLSESTGLNIVTNTGYYGAAKEKYIPRHAYNESSEEIAKRWIQEWKEGIEGSGIRPGFIKSGVDDFPLSAVQQKLVDAAALTHLQTALAIGIHTGNGKAAMEELRIIVARGANASSWIWIHAQNEKDRSIHLDAAKAGGWVSFDGFAKAQLRNYVRFLADMKKSGYLGKVLVSHDAGWYHVGEPGGGNYRGYTDIITYLVPALKQEGFSLADIEQIFHKNPSIAFAVKKDLPTKI